MATTSKDVLDWVSRYIRDHKLEIGDSLPNEIELTKRLEIGRSSVREAFAVFASIRNLPFKTWSGTGSYRRFSSTRLDVAFCTRSFYPGRIPCLSATAKSH